MNHGKKLLLSLVSAAAVALSLRTVEEPARANNVKVFRSASNLLPSFLFAVERALQTNNLLNRGVRPHIQAETRRLRTRERERESVGLATGIISISMITTAQQLARQEKSVRKPVAVSLTITWRRWWWARPFA